MTDPWMAILLRQIEAKGRMAVARELGISATTISLVLAGKYPASTDNFEARVAEIYGQYGRVNCQFLGEIEPSRCADHWQRAQTIKAAGNPATIRLYIACRKCSKRG